MLERVSINSAWNVSLLIKLVASGFVFQIIAGIDDDPVRVFQILHQFIDADESLVHFPDLEVSNQ